MVIFNKRATEDLILAALIGTCSRGNLEITSADPVTLALWLGTMQMLKGYEDAKQAEADEEAAAIAEGEIPPVVKKGPTIQ